MQGRSQQELYSDFIEFVRGDLQTERSAVNRRMWSVLTWCFLMPAGVMLAMLFMIAYGVLPRSARGYIEWMVLIFPVSYSLYFLGSEVLRQVPATFRRGGIASALGQALREGEWRNRVVENLRRQFRDVAPEDWRFIASSFRIDLDGMQYRARYLTALAGAVLFLIMQGMDALSPEEQGVSWVKTPMLGWVETNSNNLSQFVGLALFLVLLYLSGSQTYYNLKRYLVCAELLIRADLNERRSGPQLTEGRDRG